MAKKTDAVLGLILVALAGCWISAVYLTIPDASIPGTPGPRAFPLLLGWALAILGVLLTSFAFRRGGGTEVAAAREEHGVDLRRELKVVGTGFGLLLIYTFGLQKLGFIVITPLIVIAVLRYFFQVRDWRKIVVNAIGLTVGIYLVFHVLLKAQLPRGEWIQIL